MRYWPVLTSVCVVSMLGLYDFYSRLYLPYNTEIRSWQGEVVPLQFKQEIADPDQLALLLQTFGKPPAEVVENENIRDRFDSFAIGDLQIALMAIYQQQEPVAVLWMKDKQKPAEILRLRLNQSFMESVTVSQIELHRIELSYQGQIQVLRLFTPGHRSKD